MNKTSLIDWGSDTSLAPLIGNTTTISNSNNSNIINNIINNNINSNNDDLFSLMNTVFGCYLSLPVTILGTVGNIITILVLSRQKNKDTNTIILLSLAMCDVCFVTTQLTRKLSCILEFFNPVLAHTYTAYTTYVWLTGRFGFNCSVGHITLIGVERYIAVFYPFKVSVLLSKRRFFIGLAFLYVTVWFFIMPAYACVGIRNIFIEKFNATLPTLDYTWLYYSRIIVYDWYHSFNMIVWCLVIQPINGALVFYLSVSVALRIRSLSSERSKLTSTKVQTVDVRSTLMSLSISMVCFISLCPTIGFNLYMYFQPKGSGFSFLTIYNLEEFITAINSSVNVFIYMAFSSKFSSGLRQLFACKRRL